MEASMINIAICDDDKNCANDIRSMINKTKLKDIDYKIFEFNCAEDLLINYNTIKANIIFMDIVIGKFNGVEVIEKIRQIDSDVIVIFVTSYSNYVVKALRVGAFQYLTKPIDYKDFEKDFLRAIDVFKNNNIVYEFWAQKNTFIKKIKDIYCVEVMNKRITIHLEKEVYEEDERCTLRKKEEIFLPHYFVKCHKSYLVNMWKIKAISKDSIILNNDKKIPISRNFRNEVLEKFNIFISRQKI